MNDNEYGINGTQPIDPFYEGTSSQNQNYVGMQPQTQYAYTSQPEVVQEPTIPVTPQPMVEDNNISYTEIPTMDTLKQQPPMVDEDINENPNAKISLRNDAEEVIPVSSMPIGEKMDKGTIWMLIALFVGLLAVIIALPYIYELF